MRRVPIVLFLGVAVLAACAGDDDDFNEPDQGEVQRQNCVESGKITIVKDGIVIGCVTVEQYQAILDREPVAP